MLKLSFSFLLQRILGVCMFSPFYQISFTFPLAIRSLSSLLQYIPRVCMLFPLNKTPLFFPGIETLSVLGIEALSFLFVATYFGGAHTFPSTKSPSLLVAIALSFFAFVATHPKGVLSLCFLLNFSPFFPGHRALSFSSLL